MQCLYITGNRALNGAVNISGSKNAALPLMCLPLLTDAAITINKLPLLLADVKVMRSLLASIGVTSQITAPQSLTLQAKEDLTALAPHQYVNQMRASILVLGPLLARAGHAQVSLPGGCALGARPIDMHLDALAQLGAQLELTNGNVIARAPRGLIGTEINFNRISVGATQNVLMAASLAKGTTVIVNAAQEPEIVLLGDALNKMGAQVVGHGTGRITIQGQASLRGCQLDNILDRLEAGSYMFAVAATRGFATLHHPQPLHYLEQVFSCLQQAGVAVEQTATTITVDARDQQLVPVSITTAPYPGFPTDLQAQWGAFMTQANGNSTIKETIFENRFKYLKELQRLGAEIQLSGDQAMIVGGSRLHGASLQATDIRAAMGLIIGALCSEGTSVITDLHHLFRGYEQPEIKLRELGAEITLASHDQQDQMRQVAN